MRGIIKAIRLEIGSMKERWLSLFFSFILLAVIISVYYYSATSIVDWGNYVSLKIKLYDLLSSDVFSIVLIFITTQLMVLRIVGERAPYGTLDRELIAISRTDMYLGKLIANLLVVIIQVGIVFSIGFFVFPAKNYGDPILVLLLLFLISLFGLLSGFTISIFSKNREQAIQLVPIVVLILLLLSGILIPLTDMPSDMKSIAENLPLTISTNSLKLVTLDGQGFEEIQGNVTKLSTWIVGLFVIGVIKFNLERKK
jgi:ABC-2 type transport system permease protein